MESILFFQKHRNDMLMQFLLPISTKYFSTHCNLYQLKSKSDTTPTEFQTIRVYFTCKLIKPIDLINNQQMRTLQI